MLLGGAMHLWMLLVGRFLTGVAGGMTAASIPVRYNSYRINKYIQRNIRESNIPLI